MSAIWSNADAKEKLRFLSPHLQECFLRAVDELHIKESSLILDFIKESRSELRETHAEIKREQEVLRDTSDLLASKHLYGDPDDQDVNNENEMNAIDEYLKKRSRGLVGDLGLLSIEDERKGHRRHRKKDRDRQKSAVIEENILQGHDLIGVHDENHSASRRKHRKERHERRNQEKILEVEEEESHPINNEKKSRRSKSKKDEASDKNLRLTREKSTPLLEDKADIEKATNQLMQELMTRQSSDMQNRNQFEEAIKQKLAKKKNRHADEADALMRQQAWAEEELEREKSALEAKMLAKLKARKEKHDNQETAADDLAEVHQAPKEGKKKKKKKNQEDAENGENQPKKERRKKKKKVSTPEMMAE